MGDKSAQKEGAQGHGLSAYATFLLITVLYILNHTQCVIPSRRATALQSALTLLSFASATLDGIHVDLH